MRYSALIIFFATLALLCNSCEKKKTTRTIKAHIEFPKMSGETQAMVNKDESNRFKWGNTYYEVQVSRKADKELDVVTDAYNNKYYDNTVRLTITGETETILDHTFKKADFSSYVNTNYLPPSKSALLDIIFREVNDNNAIFIATIGSPEEMDDEFVLVEMSVTKTGNITMARVEELE